MHNRSINSFDADFNGTDKIYDIRKKADGEWDLLHPTPYSFTVPATPNSDTFYVVDLPEMPAKENTNGSNPAPDVYEPLVEQYTLVDSIIDVASSPTNVYCDYRRAFLVFNSVAAGKTLEVDAYYIGSKFSAKDLNDIWASITNFADENGDPDEIFEVNSDAPTNTHAINKQFADSTYAKVNGDSTEEFNASEIQVSSTKVIGNQQSAISSITDIPDATYDAVEQTMLNNLKNAMNDVLTALRNHGLIAT
jgi:hypothetical protein